MFLRGVEQRGRVKSLLRRDDIGGEEALGGAQRYDNAVTQRSISEQALHFARIKRHEFCRRSAGDSASRTSGELRPAWRPR